MTMQVTAGQPITVVARSREGGFIPNATFTIDGPVYTTSDLSEPHSELQADGSGTFVFYAPAGTVLTITCDDPIAADIEPIQVVGTQPGASGLAAVQPDQTPAVHETSPVSQVVSDASLVGVPSVPLPEDQGGALAAVGVDRATSVNEPAPDPTVATQTEAAQLSPAEPAPAAPVEGESVEVTTTAVPSEPSTSNVGNVE